MQTTEFTAHMSYLKDIESSATRNKLRPLKTVNRIEDPTKKQSGVTVLVPVAISVIGLAAFLSAVA